MAQKLQGGEIKITSICKMISVYIDDFAKCTVKQLKLKIQDEIGVPPLMQKLELRLFNRGKIFLYFQWSVMGS